MSRVRASSGNGSSPTAGVADLVRINLVVLASAPCNCLEVFELNAAKKSLRPTCTQQVDGKAQIGPDLSVTHFSGLKLPNPFVIGSGENMHAFKCNSFICNINAGRNYTNAD